ncbi:translin [Methanococcus maripaludis]|uniref:Translin n=1 Tax=Methanococcus maripaludis TaxID=39152 RepID=A0A7J9NFV6_METMI|nr:haloacid dehalogenase [Methanococcus maripaludis]MBA2839674.1 translin [Methanococcus maripaludis]MBA2852251.1 translin [Methanococcus maripaludis]MBB6401398.1 translin [Methanococcus maripaludis]
MKNSTYLLEFFEKKNETREKILKISREIVKDCGLIIRKTQKGDQVDFSDIKEKLKELKNYSETHFEFQKYRGTPEQEYVEARVYYSVIFENKILEFSDFEGTLEENYILGLCDVIGELRRITLESIRKDEKTKAELYFEYMDRIYDFLMEFDNYHVIDGLRRKQDVSRSLIEKTHGDIVNFNENLKLRMELSKFNK